MTSIFEGLPPWIPEESFPLEIEYGDPIDLIEKAIENHDKAKIVKLLYSYNPQIFNMLNLNNDIKMIKLRNFFLNNLFIESLGEVLNNSKFSIEERIFCNHLIVAAWDQLTDETADKFNLIIDELSDLQDPQFISLLQTIVDDYYKASKLGIIRYSSFNEDENICKTIIDICINNNNLSPQQLEKLFEYLFKQTSFKRVFCMVMSFYNTDLPEDAKKCLIILYNIALRILDIGFSYPEIFLIVNEYKNYCVLTGTYNPYFDPCRPREFIKDNFPRIYNVLKGVGNQ